MSLTISDLSSLAGEATASTSSPQTGGGAGNIASSTDTSSPTSQSSSPPAVTTSSSSLLVTEGCSTGRLWSAALPPNSCNSYWVSKDDETTNGVASLLFLGADSDPVDAALSQCVPFAGIKGQCQFVYTGRYKCPGDYALQSVYEESAGTTMTTILQYCCPV